MAYKVLAKGNHRCELPEAGDFRLGAEIECIDPVLRGGVTVLCGLEWHRCESFWKKTPKWEARDYGW